MTASQHRPASLPVDVMPGRDEEGCAVAMAYEKSFDDAVQTAEFLTHAGRAYPKLIAYLQKESAENPTGPVGVEARTLLRELGEAP